MLTSSQVIPEHIHLRSRFQYLLATFLPPCPCFHSSSPPKTLSLLPSTQANFIHLFGAGHLLELSSLNLVTLHLKMRLILELVSEDRSVGKILESKGSLETFMQHRCLSASCAVDKSTSGKSFLPSQNTVLFLWLNARWTESRCGDCVPQDSPTHPSSAYSWIFIS